MSEVQGQVEIKNLIAPMLERLAAQPAAGLLGASLDAAVSTAQRGWQWSLAPALIRIGQAAVVATVVVAGVMVGIRVSELSSTMPSGLAAPIQSECRPLQADAVCVSIGWGTGYGVPDGRADDLPKTVLQILPNLGAAYTGPRGEELSSNWPLPLMIDVDSSSGSPLKWEASTGERGEVTRVAIDLTALAHGTGPAFVLLDYSSIAGIDPDAASAYAVPDELGHELLDIFGIPRQGAP